MVSREPDRLFAKFVEDFPKLKLKWRMPDSEWSKRIFTYLGDLGKNEGFKVLYQNNPIEYLLDMCWIYEEDKPPVGWIEVGFEIEFSKDYNCNLDELSKLVDVKAYTKVLLCQSKPDDTEHLLASTSEMIRYNPFKFTDEHYLLMIITETRKQFSITGFVFDCIGNSLLIGSKNFPK